MKRTSRCKGCGSEILWRYTPNQRLMPLDPGTTGTPAPGTYVIVNDEDCRPADALFDEPGTEYHMNHWTTCNQADQFRAKGH